MDIRKVRSEYEEIIFPKLTVFTATKIHANRLVNGALGKLESKIDEEIEVRFEFKPIDATTEPSSGNARIVVRIKLEGVWRQKETAIEIATYIGEYRGVFQFDEPTGLDEVKAHIHKQFYRDVLTAQAYPLARKHMFDQVSSMGIATSRALGYEINERDRKTVRTERTLPAAAKPRVKKSSVKQLS